MVVGDIVIVYLYLTITRPDDDLSRPYKALLRYLTTHVTNLVSRRHYNGPLPFSDSV
jgi:hypothetical protein